MPSVGPLSPTDPAPAGREIYALLARFSVNFAHLTLHYFTRKNQYFTHFTGLYTGFRPLSGLHTHVAYFSG